MIDHHTESVISTLVKLQSKQSNQLKLSRTKSRLLLSSSLGIEGLLFVVVCYI